MTGLNKYDIIGLQIKRGFATPSHVHTALKAVGLPNFSMKNNQLTRAFGADYFFAFLAIYINRLMRNIPA